MRERLLWDRFLIHWLPPDKVTGSARKNIDRAFALTYPRDNGKVARYNYMGAAFAVITAGRTIVVADAHAVGLAANAPPMTLGQLSDHALPVAREQDALGVCTADAAARQQRSQKLDAGRLLRREWHPQDHDVRQQPR